MRIAALAAALWVGAAFSSAAGVADRGSAFSISFPAARSATPLDGRVILLISAD